MDITRGLVKTRFAYIHYRAAGAGLPIMLFHINQQSSALYLELMAVLAPHFRVIAMDYPGHGMSDHVTEQPRIEDYAEAAVEVMESLGIRKSVLLGEAVGTAVSSVIAGKHPERVVGAVFLNCPLTPSTGKSGEIGRIVSEIRKTRRPADSTGFPLTRELSFVLDVDGEHAPVNATQSWMDRINLAQVEAGRDRWQASTAFVAFDLRSALRKVKCPVLLLTSGQAIFANYRADVASCLADVTSELIADSRFCMGWEHAEEVGRRTIAFFAAARSAQGG